MNQIVKDKKVAVIGAGAAGLISAKTLSLAGFNVTVFEKGSCIGGLWNIDNDNNMSVAYDNLHINTDTFLTELKDFPFKSGVRDYAHHTEMLEYLESYAKEFKVDKLIQYKSEITKITSIGSENNPLWKVEVNNEYAGDFTTIVVATGHLHLPRWPNLPGKFSGSYTHAASYKNIKPFLDKRVCVIGFGNSALDIATDLSHVSLRTVVSARTGAVIWPKYVFGYPLTRLAGKVQEFRFLPMFIRNKLFKKWNRLMVKLVWGDLKKYNIHVPEKQAHPISNQFFLSEVKYGRIIVKSGITLIEGKKITFADGTTEEFDSLIAATGYSVEFPFIEQSKLQNNDTVLPLYKRVVPPDMPGLYFVGYFNLDWASNPVYEQQAIWIKNIESGICELPSKNEMWVEINNRQNKVMTKFHKAPRMNLEVEYGPYTKELRVAQRIKFKQSRVTFWLP